LWAIVGIYSILGALCAIELAVSLPQAGAWYVYARRAFGDYIGFVTGITSWLGTVSAVGFGAYTLSEYIILLWPGLDGNNVFVAICFILLVTGFHSLGSRSGGKSQEVLAVIKAVGLLSFVFICFYYGKDTSVFDQSTNAKSANKALSIFAIITAMQAIFYTYDGWHTATYFTEENKDPAKTLPKSMITGTILVMVIYLLVNAAIMNVLPMEQLAGTKLAAADAIKSIFGDGVGKIVTIFLLISILGICNAQIMFAPRVIYSMGRDGLFFNKMTLVNSGGSPYVALGGTALLSSLLILSGKETCGILSDIATFFFVLSYCAGFAALLRLRHTEPLLNRSFRVPFYPWLPIGLLIVSILFLIGSIYSDLRSSMYALIFLVISYPLYRLIKKKGTNPSS
jgi:APA family basic amino acid/polyamine antiporter